MHQAFSFRGQRGSLNARKERRRRGTGYWYGYRSREGRTVKRYLGPTAHLTLARLEEAASSLERADGLPDAPLLTERTGANNADAAADPGGPAHASPVAPRSLKFRPPRLRERLVERPRLLRLLEDGQAAGLTLLSAPAGSGKTTLITRWLASLEKDEPLVAWVSLDAGSGTSPS